MAQVIDSNNNIIINNKKPQPKTNDWYNGYYAGWYSKTTRDVRKVRINDLSVREKLRNEGRADERAKTLKEVKGKLYYMVDRQNAKCFFEWLEAELKKVAK